MAAPTVEIDNVRQNRNSIFSARPALVALALYIIGIIVSVIVSVNYLFPLSMAIISLVATIYFYAGNDRDKAAWSAVAMLICVGWYNASLSSGPFPPNHIEKLARAGGRAEIIGKVSEEPDIRADRTYLVVDVDSVVMGKYGIPSFGKARLKISRGGSRYDHADLIRADGYLYTPQGPRNPLAFDYAAYLHTKNIHACMSVTSPRDVMILRREKSFLGSVISPLRDYLLARTKESLNPVSAAVISGFILGERRDIPPEYQTMFKNTGTLHLMAVSGSNVGLVLAVFALPLTLLRTPRKLKVLFLLGVIIFFAILTRLESSVVRASIMASVGLLAYGWLRNPDYLNVLGLAGLVMLLWNPSQIFDVGLQLSFAATFAIVYAIPDTLSWLGRFRMAKFGPLRWLIALLITTLAAQFGVMPLLARYFNNFPMVGIIANIPIGILAMISTFLGIGFYFLSLFGRWAAEIMAFPLEAILDGVTYFLKFFSSLPGANIKTISPSWPGVFVFWIVLYIFYEILCRRRISKRSMMAALFALNLLIWPGLFEKKPSWRLDFIDIGRNKAWVLSNGAGKTISAIDLFDDGNDPAGLIIPHILNFFDGRLDCLITSTREASGIKELQDQFSPKVISLDSLAFEFTRRYPTSGTAKNYIILDGLSEDAKVVWGESDNRKESIVPSLLFEAGGSAFGFGADSKAEGLMEFGEGRRMTLLELPWSMYAQHSCLELVNMLDPEVLVFSPDRSTVSMPLSRADLTHSENLVFSTSICGGFSVTETTGKIKVRTMRQISGMRE